MLTLTQARIIIETAEDYARKKAFKPIAIQVLDARGALKMGISQDKTSLKRNDIAYAKAFGAVAMGTGSRGLMSIGAERPAFLAGATHAIGGSLVPVPGGVLIRDGAGDIIGAVGISGDTSDNDEAAAIAGIEAAGLKPDPGV
jgi:uncharacterized protein GlcG (DUF336 family)